MIWWRDTEMGGNSYFIFFQLWPVALWSYLTNWDKEMPIQPSFRIFRVDHIISKNGKIGPQKAEISQHVSHLESGCCKMSHHRHARVSSLCSSFRKTKDRQTGRPTDRQTENQTIRQRDIPTSRQTTEKTLWWKDTGMGGIFFSFFRFWPFDL